MKPIKTLYFFSIMLINLILMHLFMGSFAHALVIITDSDDPRLHTGVVLENLLNLPEYDECFRYIKNNIEQFRSIMSWQVGSDYYWGVNDFVLYPIYSDFTTPNQKQRIHTFIQTLVKQCSIENERTQFVSYDKRINWFELNRQNFDIQSDEAFPLNEDDLSWVKAQANTLASDFREIYLHDSKTQIIEKEIENLIWTLDQINDEPDLLPNAEDFFVSLDDLAMYEQQINECILNASCTSVLKDKLIQRMMPSRIYTESQSFPALYLDLYDFRQLVAQIDSLDDSTQFARKYLVFVQTLYAIQEFLPELRNKLNMLDQEPLALSIDNITLHVKQIPMGIERSLSWTYSMINTLETSTGLSITIPTKLNSPYIIHIPNQSIQNFLNSSPDLKTILEQRLDNHRTQLAELKAERQNLVDSLPESIQTQSGESIMTLYHTTRNIAQLPGIFVQNPYRITNAFTMYQPGVYHYVNTLLSLRNLKPDVLSNLLFTPQQIQDIDSWLAHLTTSDAPGEQIDHSGFMIFSIQPDTGCIKLIHFFGETIEQTSFPAAVIIPNGENVRANYPVNSELAERIDRLPFYTEVQVTGANEILYNGTPRLWYCIEYKRGGLTKTGWMIASSLTDQFTPNRGIVNHDEGNVRESPPTNIYTNNWSDSAIVHTLRTGHGVLVDYAFTFHYGGYPRTWYHIHYSYQSEEYTGWIYSDSIDFIGS